MALFDILLTLLSESFNFISFLILSIFRSIEFFFFKLISSSFCNLLSLFCSSIFIFSLNSSILISSFVLVEISILLLFSFIFLISFFSFK